MLAVIGSLTSSRIAGAVTSCVWDVDTATVSIVADPDATLSVQDGVLAVDGSTCDPAATVDSIEAIFVEGTPDANVVRFELAGGPFAPGPFAIGVGIGVSLGDGSDTVEVEGSDERDVWVVRPSGIDWTNDRDIDVSLSDEDIVLRGGGGDDFINARAAGRPVEAWGGLGWDTIFGSSASDVLKGGGGRDALYPALGNDQIRGGADRDSVLFLRGGPGVVVSLRAGDASGQGVDSLVGVEWVAGTKLDDTIRGDERRNALSGRGGSDLLVGRGGDDRLFGRGGGDTVRGGADDDLIAAGYGNDEAVGGDGADILNGDRGDDVLLGRRGRDLLDGGGETDRCHQGAGWGPRGGCERPVGRILYAQTRLDPDDVDGVDIASTSRTVWSVEGERFVSFGLTFHERSPWWVTRVWLDSRSGPGADEVVRWWSLDPASTVGMPAFGCRVLGKGRGVIADDATQTCTIPLRTVGVTKAIRWRLGAHDAYTTAVQIDFAPSATGWFG